MGEIPTQLLVFRLLVAAVAIFGPTVLFLGFWRGLQWLEDDELVEVLASRGVVEQPKPAPVDVLEPLSGESHRRCEECGATNVSGATHCRRCAGRLE